MLAWVGLGQLFGLGLFEKGGAEVLAPRGWVAVCRPTVVGLSTTRPLALLSSEAKCHVASQWLGCLVALFAVCAWVRTLRLWGLGLG